MTLTRVPAFGRALIPILAAMALVVALGALYSDVFADPVPVDDPIFACVNEETGHVYIVDEQDSCPPGYQKVDWNREGAPGQDGQDGQDGVSGYQRVEGLEGNFGGSPDGPRTASVSCPSDKKVLGGGVDVYHSNASSTSSQRLVMEKVHVSASYPSSDSAWTVKLWSQDQDSSYRYKVYATCALMAE